MVHRKKLFPVHYITSRYLLSNVVIKKINKKIEKYSTDDLESQVQICLGISKL